MWHEFISDPKMVFPLAGGLVAATVLLAVVVWRLQRRELAPARRYVPSRQQRTRPRSEPVEPVATHERRRAYRRRTGMSVKVLLHDPGSSVARMEGWVFDRSVGGLGLEVSRPVAAGTRFDVRPSGGSDPVQIEVRHCKQASGQYRLGCQFISSPSAQVLMQFG